jgi:AraC family transcriptional regulator, arabinose operon regulatory protein
MSRRETPHPTFGEICTGHFRQGKGYGAWRSKGTRDWLFIYTVSGSGRFGHAGGEWASAPGDATLLRPGTLHDYGVKPPEFWWELLWAHFHPRVEWLEWLAWPEIAPGLMNISIADSALRQSIVARLRDMHALSGSSQPRSEALAMNALEEVFLWCDAQNPRQENNRVDVRIRGCMEFVCRNLNSMPSITKLANQARLSESRLSHLFKEQVGSTPQEYIEQQRLNRARQLLELTRMSIKEIAYDVGYANAYYFSQRFHKRYGMSPRVFRQKATVVPV